MFMIDLPESKSLYDTPRSTRPSSVVNQGHYDSPRYAYCPYGCLVIATEIFQFGPYVPEIQQF